MVPQNGLLTRKRGLSMIRTENWGGRYRDRGQKRYQTMRMTAQLYTFIVFENREETSASVCDQGSHDTAVDGRVTDFCQAVRAIPWQLISCCAAVRGSQFPIKLFGPVFLVRQHFSIAHEKVLGG
jgi:hypothetical protein